jgi:hypothetical protein
MIQQQFPISDSQTSASEIVSPIARSWVDGLLTTLRTASELTGLDLAVVEELVRSGKVRTERAGSRCSVADVIINRPKK